MLGITKYILRQLLTGMVLVSVALACVLWLTQSLRFVELIINKGLSVGTFVSLTLLLIPNFLSVILPISLFAVVLFTYNKLTMDRELIVLRAAGVSEWGLARPALILAGAAAILGYALNLYVIPKSVQGFRELQWNIRNDISGLLLQEGIFNQISPGLTIYLRSRTAEGELQGILVHDKRNPERPVTLMAERGALVYTNTSPRVLMINGNRQEVRVGTGRLSLLYFDNYTVEFGAGGGGSGEARFRDARERMLMDLLTTTEEELGPTDYRRFRIEAHQRLSSPFYYIGFALIALASLLSGSFNRRGQNMRIMGAVAAMVLLQASALGAANLATANLSLAPLIYLNALLPIAIGWFGMTYRPRRRTPGVPAAMAAA